MKNFIELKGDLDRVQKLNFLNRSMLISFTSQLVIKSSQRRKKIGKKSTFGEFLGQALVILLDYNRHNTKALKFRFERNVTPLDKTILLKQ